MTISSSDMGRLNPLLSTTAAEMERVAPESDNTWITGSLQSLDGQGNPIPYLQSASHPVLTSIQENTSNHEPEYPRPNQETTSFNFSFGKELAASQENGGMTPTQAAQVKYYLLHPNETPPSTIKELVDRTMTSATARHIQENNLPADWKPTLNQSPNSEAFDAQVSSAWSQAFEQQVKDKPDAATLRFEHYNREPGTPLTADEQAALASIKTDFGIPETYIPTADTTEFTNEANADFTASFSTLLKEQGFSSEDMAKLEHMHFHPEASVSGTINGKDINEVSARLNGEARAASSQENGIQGSFDFKPLTSSYDAKLYGSFLDHQDRSVQAYAEQNSLSASDFAALKAVLADPTVAGSFMLEYGHFSRIFGRISTKLAVLMFKWPYLELKWPYSPNPLS